MVDQGGTFTDIIAIDPNNKIIIEKILSKKPEKHYNPVLIGVNKIINSSKHFSKHQINNIKIGTTIGTNALLERKGYDVLLIVTKGFKDNFIIGTQQRKLIFKRHHSRKEKLYNNVLELEERISAKGKVLIKLDEKKTFKTLEKYFKQGVNSISIILINSFNFPKHEILIKNIAKEIGFKNISCSHEVCPIINFTSRGYTTLVDAYLNPIIKSYIESVEGNLNAENIYYMQSNGFLTKKNDFNGRNAVLSGPAGGVNGGIEVAKSNKINTIVGFDMGGTSADIWHYNGEIEKRLETKISEVFIKTPTLEIDSIAAGGGSITQYQDGRFTVGPESAGSFPGPACYRNNGPLTLTDCNLSLGRISESEFPKLFGKSKKLSISTNYSEKKLKVILKSVQKKFREYTKTLQIAEAFLNVAVENMANAIKKITIQKGFDIRTYTLLSFGSASGQYCCKVADSIGIQKIIFSPYSSVLSAFGIGVSKQGSIYQLSVEKKLLKSELNSAIKNINKIILKNDLKQVTYVFRIKYYGCNTIVSIKKGNKNISNIKEAFLKKHKKSFGFNYKNRTIIIDSIQAELYQGTLNKENILIKNDSIYKKTKIAYTKIYSKNKWLRVRKINRNFFTKKNKKMNGPAVFTDYNTTIVIEKNWFIKKLDTGSYFLGRTKAKKNQYTSSKKSNPEMLEVFNSIFFSIAEQMGLVLKNTAQSINVKERSDFSCALFTCNGDLIANAPHIPIHLGAMSDTVKYLIKKFSSSLNKGNSLLHNNPFSGGTHLPDLTVVTPYFNKTKNKVLFYLANRAHHSDIGGIFPGSMPAFSKQIEDEGIIFNGLSILKNKKINEKEILNILKKQTFPARDPIQNLYDIKAQLAANQKGIIELDRIIKNYGVNTVKNYVMHIQKNCSDIVLNTIKNIPNSKYQIKLDNNSTIKVSFTFNKLLKKLIINFDGTSKQLNNNFNAPIAVTKSVIVYFLRTLIKKNIPLNEGFLKDIKIIIPKNCMLDPKYPAPVVAGNVETSQSLIDVLNGSISIQAACYGTMNNITFGDNNFGYYETICGGEGASFENNGSDAVHCHMTNTSITDPEILEYFYPVRVKSFSIRTDSGGLGKWSGGNGVIREIEFLKKLDLSILSNRRVTAPFGIKNGEPGKSGENWLKRLGKNKIKLLHVCQTKVFKGDILTIKTPGGGGYGNNN